MSGKMWASTRYSNTRRRGAQHIVGTKITENEYNVLHYLAKEREISDYEYLRQMIQSHVINKMLNGDVPITK